MTFGWFDQNFVAVIGFLVASLVALELARQVHAWVKRRRPHGEPIRLVFQCEDWITNNRPLVLTDEQRRIAVDQAKHTRCPDCAPWVWRQVGPLWQPELQAALRDAWK
jgi:predicted ATPase